MKLSLDRLKKERKLSLEYDDPKTDGFDPRETPAGPLKVTLEVRFLEERTLGISGSAAGDFTVVCDRCAETLAKHRTFTIAETYEVSPEELVRREVDISARVLEYVLEEVPMQVLCSPDCKGLCPVCGANRNKGPCAHERGSI